MVSLLPLFLHAIVWKYTGSVKRCKRWNHLKFRNYLERKLLGKGLQICCFHYNDFWFWAFSYDFSSLLTPQFSISYCQKFVPVSLGRSGPWRELFLLLMTAAVASSAAKAFQDVKTSRLAAVLNKIYSAVHCHRSTEAQRGLQRTAAVTPM